VEVSEVTRTGQAVRTARFMAGRVLALVEHPAADAALAIAASEHQDGDAPAAAKRPAYEW
ncbi:MAG TPA: hypothetical protein VML96_07245, partial [Egibacteraceae bacterium]|nr:hypothetical protein [Egibacteraceae bacterium]